MAENIFYTKFSAIGDRLDPLFHVGIENMRANIIKKANYKSHSLHQLCTINRGRFGHRPRNDPKFYGGKYPFIQTGDIVNASINNSKIEYKQTLNDLGLATSKLFEPSKLLFTIAANIGDTAILDYQSCFPDSIVALIPKDEKLKIEYLNIYFKIIKPYIVALAPYAAQRNLNNQQLSEIPIIAPPINIQNQIVSKMEYAYKQKHQKENEAQKLLDSIDEYLLNELGIEPLSNEKESLKDRVFFRKFSELSGDRWDSEFYQPKHIINEANLFSSKYEISNIKNIVTFIASGSTPKSGGDDYEENGNIYFLRLTNFNDNLEVDLTKSLYIKSDIHNKMLKRSQLQNGDILFGIAGSIGKIAIFDKSIEANINQAIATLRFKEKINKLFIAYLLNSSIVKQQTARLQRPVAQPNLNTEELKSLKIPLPPIEIQNKIANYIQQLRDEAQSLKNEAIQIFEGAKKDVEAMLLGEASAN